jgi:cobalt-zinc-cadmium efflux system outer membrane protein
LVKIRIVILFGFSFSTAWLPAAVLNVRDAVRLATAQNPDVRSLRRQIESAEAKSWLALAPSEPSLTLNYNDMNTAINLNSAASTSYQISQPLAFPGKAWVNHSLLNDQTKALRSQLRSAELTLANTVKGAYYNLALVRKNIEINTSQENSYEQILAIAKRRYESGAITQVDLMFAQSSIYTNENDLLDLNANEKSVRAQLNLLLSKNSDDEIEVEPLQWLVYPALDKAATLDKMITNRPEIAAAQHTRDASEKTRTLAWMSLLPDFQFYLGTTYYNVPGATPFSNTTNDNHTYMVGVQLVIPIWGLLNERENIISANGELAVAEANVSSLYLQSKITLENSLQTLAATRSKLENYKLHLLPLAKQTLDLALVSYSSNKIDFQTLTGAANTWRQTRRDFYALIVSYLTTYFSVGQLIGEDL